MNNRGVPIPVLETIDFDGLVKHTAFAEGRTESEVLGFISNRASLQAGLELLVVPLLVTGPFIKEKTRAEPLLQAFEDYLIDKSYKPPELMWEPIGLTWYDPILNEEVHKITGEKSHEKKLKRGRNNDNAGQRLRSS